MKASVAITAAFIVCMSVICSAIGCLTHGPSGMLVAGVSMNIGMVAMLFARFMERMDQNG